MLQAFRVDRFGVGPFAGLVDLSGVASPGAVDHAGRAWLPGNRSGACMRCGVLSDRRGLHILGVVSGPPAGGPCLLGGSVDLPAAVRGPSGLAVVP